MMKIDISQKIVGRYDKDIIIPGTELKDPEGKEIPNTGERTTLKSVCIDALLFPKSKVNEKTGIMEETDTFDEKMKKYRIYEKFKATITDIELTVEEITQIKKLISEIKTQLIVGQCNDMLEGGKPKPKQK